MKIQDIYRQSKDKYLSSEDAKNLLHNLNGYIKTLDKKPQKGEFTVRNASNAILAYRNLYQKHNSLREDITKESENICGIIKHYTPFLMHKNCKYLKCNGKARVISRRP